MPWSRKAHRHLLKADPPLAALVRRYGMVTRHVSPDYFGRLVRAIVGQQISGKAAVSIYRRLSECVGDPMTPQAVAALSEEAARGCGLSANKWRSIRDLAEHALDGRLDLAHLESLPDEEVREQLIAVRGIGPWTADMFLMFTLGRPDVLPAEDLGIQNAVMRLYGLETRPSPAAIRERAAAGNWHPYATAACYVLWESLDDPAGGGA